jgi:hypothetical protein
MKVLDPGGGKRRYPSKGARGPKKRTPLTDVAVFYEIHLDGHEKLNFKALRMGKASIDIYGGRCHGSGYLVLMDVVPNARCGATCGHLYLDMVESTGCMLICVFLAPKLTQSTVIPIQLTVDGGTETKYMGELHSYLRYVVVMSSTSTTDLP